MGVYNNDNDPNNRTNLNKVTDSNNTSVSNDNNTDNKEQPNTKRSVKKAVQDGEYGKYSTHTQNVYFDKEGYKNIQDSWNVNQNIITPSEP